MLAGVSSVSDSFIISAMVLKAAVEKLQPLFLPVFFGLFV
jgi:hypothetical protein